MNPKRISKQVRYLQKSLYLSLGQPIASVFPKILYESETVGKSELRPSDSKISQAPTQVHMFWVEGALSRLELLSINSFVANGFSVTLWSYGTIKNVPTSVNVRDAREIIAEKQFFLGKSGSIGPFSDLFRYRLLTTHIGIWSDFDVICDIDEADFRKNLSQPFIATERHLIRGMVKVNGNLIHVTDLNQFSIIHLALGVSERFDKSQINHLELGPQLLTALAVTYPSLRPKLLHPTLANPINHWDAPRRLLDARAPKLQDPAFIHCFNEMWNRSGADKWSKFPVGNLLWQLEQKYS